MNSNRKRETEVATQLAIELKRSGRRKKVATAYRACLVTTCAIAIVHQYLEGTRISTKPHHEAL